MSDVRICVECRHYSKDKRAIKLWPGYEHRCGIEVACPPDLVTGEITKFFPQCSDQRTEFGRCGPDGKLWQAKE